MGPSSAERLPGSFRDPSGFVFRREGKLFRKISERGKEDFERFRRSGLAEKLVREGPIGQTTFLSELENWCPNWKFSS